MKVLDKIERRLISEVDENTISYIGKGIRINVKDIGHVIIVCDDEQAAEEVFKLITGGIKFNRDGIKEVAVIDSRHIKS